MHSNVRWLHSITSTNYRHGSSTGCTCMTCLCNLDGCITLSLLSLFLSLSPSSSLGGPADKAGLCKGDAVLAVDGQDITRLSHKEVKEVIRGTTSKGVWLSVCESSDCNSLNSSVSSSVSSSGYFSTSLPKRFASTPVLFADSQTSPRRSINGHSKNRAHDGSMMSESYGSPSRVSPLVHRVTQNDSTYVTLVPMTPYVTTRMSAVVLYCGPVKIPDSWAYRGVSSHCVQESARQLLSKRQSNSFLRVLLEVSQTSMKLTDSTGGNILVQHHRSELYFTGMCTSDEQYFAIVTRNMMATPPISSSANSVAELCHVFKLLPDSKLSTYCIDRTKSQRESRAGQPMSLKSCVDIVDTIQAIFSSSPVEANGAPHADEIGYGIVRGISTFQLANVDIDQPGTVTGSPLLKRKKSNVVDLRGKTNSLPEGSILSKQRSLASMTTLPLAITNSGGVIRSNNSDAHHVRMHSDGSTHQARGMTYARPQISSVLRLNPRHDPAKRISDSSLSSISSDQSGHRSSRSSSPSPLKSLSYSPPSTQQVREEPRLQLHPTPHHRKSSNPVSKHRAVSPDLHGSKLRRQVSHFFKNKCFGNK